MSREPQRFGRSDEDWDALVDATTAFLEERARLGRTTSYSEVNWAIARRTGLPTFDFSLDRDRAAMGAILGEVVDETIGESGVMMSAIVVYIDRNDAGPGFYKLAQLLGLLPPSATADDKLRFWSGQVKQVLEKYRRPRRVRATSD
jgi:hypothetical protein